MNVEKGLFWALIPARGGSKGVPRKNIKNLGGFPLIAYSIACCELSNKISRIIVSTDDYEIAKVARKYGAEVPFIRPKEAAGDKSPDYEFVKHAIDWFDKNEGKCAEFLVHIRPTTPFRQPLIVDKALDLIWNSEEYTSLRSAHIAPESPYKWFLRKDDNTFCCVSDHLDNEMANGNRGDFPTVYIPDGYVDVIKTEFVKNNKKLHGEKMLAFESPFCTEVDTQDEFDYLEYQVIRFGSSLYDYLSKKMETNYEKSSTFL